MLTRLDTVLFPKPHLIEVEPNRVIYPIFKNGSSSLENTPGVRFVLHDEIKYIDTVEVYVREPFDRFISGVQSYLNYNPDLDRDTVLKLIREHLFLNRHFVPQFHWLLNLRRYGDPWLKIRHINELKDTTSLTWNALTRDQSLIDYFADHLDLMFYLELDKPLIENFMGRVIKFSTLVNYIKQHSPGVYVDIIEQAKNICGVLD